MYKKVLFWGVLSVLLLPVGVWATASVIDNTASPVESLIKEQGVSEVGNLDCSKIKELDFEKTGEYVMGIIHPDSKEHELMDRMMGGEGSSSLRAAHSMMGRRYLGCWSRGNMMKGDMFENMMGQCGLMGCDNDNRINKDWSDVRHNSMMGNWNQGMMGMNRGGFMWFWWVLRVLSWFFMILGIIYLVELIAGRKKRK